MYITRKSEEFLLNWMGQRGKKPLIIRGARQTGKSRLVKEFGERHYDNLVTINFEKEPSLKRLFDKAEVKELIRDLELIKNVTIEHGKTLIFIDEIQECPQALTKLRYFYEDLPEQDVIAAGSLLEFVLENENLSFPVGRVDFHYLFPLTFKEFLGGGGRDKLVKLIEEITAKEAMSPQVHEELRKLLREYMLVGGMPEASVCFLETGQYIRAEQAKESIIETYRDDFKKYSKRVNIDNLDLIFREAPKWIGQRLNLSKAGAGEIGPRDAGTAINLLQRAMILYRVNRAQSVSFPLLAYKKAQPKIVFLDLGLVQYVNHISKEILESENYHSVYKGGFAEQLVGQEFLPVLGGQRRPELFYWQREAKGSSAEMDYIFPFGQHLLPVEVKAGRGTTLFSLHQFVAQHKPPIAIRIYDGVLRLENVRVSSPDVSYNLLSIPLYMVSEIERLLKEIIPT